MQHIKVVSPKYPTTTNKPLEKQIDELFKSTGLPIRDKDNQLVALISQQKKHLRTYDWLQMAIKNGCIQTTEKLLENQPPLNHLECNDSLLPLAIESDYSDASTKKEMVKLLIDKGANANVKIKTFIEINLWESQNVDVAIRQMLYQAAGHAIDTSTYTVEECDEGTFYRNVENVLKFNSIDSTDVKIQFKKWLDNRSENGFCEDDIKDLWSLDSSSVKYFLTHFVSLPNNYNIDRLTHGFFSRDKVTRKPFNRFYPRDKNHQKILQFLNNGDPVAHDQEKIDYDGFSNTMVGEFLGKTLNGKKQDLIGSILTFCLFCRQNGTTPEAMGDIITQIINKKDNVSFTPATFSLQTVFLGFYRLGWNQDCYFKQQLLYLKAGEVIKQTGFNQSPQKNNGSKNPYHLTHPFLSQCLRSSNRGVFFNSINSILTSAQPHHIAFTSSVLICAFLGVSLQQNGISKSNLTIASVALLGALAISKSTGVGKSS